MNHMYIRHTVGGRLFLDSKKHHTTYQIESNNSCWKFIIDVTDEQMAKDILQYRDELNIFEITEGQTKSWYYTRNGDVEYDKASQKLIILADSKLDYPV